MPSRILAQHFERLLSLRPDSKLEELPEGAALVKVPGVKLRAGWSKGETTVWFQVSGAYPEAVPDCFWADSDLRLAGGGSPTNSGAQNLPKLSTPVLWFSWHVRESGRNWNASRDDLVAYLHVIEERFEAVR